MPPKEGGGHPRGEGGTGRKYSVDNAVVPERGVLHSEPVK
jgi:hypothetical protein